MPKLFLLKYLGISISFFLGNSKFILKPPAMTAGARGVSPRTAETDRWLYHECERDTVFRKDRPLAGPATREGQSKTILSFWLKWFSVGFFIR